MMAEKETGFQWYWLLASEVTFAFFAIGVYIIAFRDISPWAKYVCTLIVAVATYEASEYGKRLRT
jgi:cytochrome bd-type quinol oxidase subunit 1